MDLRVEIIQLLSDLFRPQQQGQLVAQEVEEQSVIGLQGLGGVMMRWAKYCCCWRRGRLYQ